MKTYVREEKKIMQSFVELLSLYVNYTIAVGESLYFSIVKDM
jgi:hypothetical protein